MHISEFFSILIPFTAILVVKVNSSPYSSTESNNNNNNNEDNNYTNKSQNNENIHQNNLTTPPAVNNEQSPQPQPEKEIIKIGSMAFNGPNELASWFMTRFGTMMCYKNWEDSLKTTQKDPFDFHSCNLCFNETQTQQDDPNDPTEKYKSCSIKYLEDSPFKACHEFLENPNLSTKEYAIILHGPKTEYPFKTYIRCVNGIVYYEESKKCVEENENFIGREMFLNRFACLLKILSVHSKKFSEKNREALLSSIPASLVGNSENLTENTTPK